MKKTLLFIFVLGFAFSTFAQNSFQNAGFESWTGNSPTGWNTLGVSGLTLSDISKVTTPHSGTYAIGVAAKPLSPTIATMISTLLGTEVPSGMVIPGLLTNSTIDLLGAFTLLGGSDTTEMDFNSLLAVFTDGTPVTTNPISIDGYYNWSPTDSINEYFSMVGLVVSNTSGTREVVGFGAFPMDFSKNNTKLVYNSFSIPILYLNPTASATEVIFLATTMNDDTTSNTFTKLYLDDLTITTGVGLSKIITGENSFAIYPNPSNGEFSIGANDAEVRVVNILGQEVIPSMKYFNDMTLKIEEKGVYFVSVKQGTKSSVEKLIIK